MNRTTKYYAVLSGRDGPKIYNNINDFKQATQNYGSSCSKSFFTHDEASAWLSEKGIQIDQFRGRRTSATLTRTRNLSTEQSFSYSVEDESGLRSVTISTSSSRCGSRANSVAPSDHSRASIPPKVSLRDPLTDQGEPTVAPVQSPEIQLSEEQRRVFNLVKSGKSLFFTGPAGTGKSVLLREIIRSLRSEGASVAVTATTGIASANIGGSTVHSFAGIGLGKEEAHKLARIILNSSRKREKWRVTKVLIIDEVSMMDGRLFDKLEYIARKVRACELPFGGLQLVLSGDFFQLPPVPDESHEHRMPSTFAFDALAWRRSIEHIIILKQVFRQKDDGFIRILTAMRSGSLAQEHIKQLRALARPLQYPDGIEPSYLFPTRKEVEACNNNRLGALPGIARVFPSMDSIGYDHQCRPIPEDATPRLFDQLNAPRKIGLKQGAQVMLIQNVVQGSLVNGSTGKVVDFLTTHEAMDRKIQIAQPQLKPVPERYASAQLRSCTPDNFSRQERYPLVKFINGLELLCAPLEFTVQGFMGNVEVRRFQVPLMLAWAISIHKSQGQTLQRVKIDLGHVFERGQAYVAISRATSMEDLEIVNFHPGKVMAHPRVIEWHEECLKATFFDEEMDCEEAVTSYWGSF